MKTIPSSVAYKYRIAPEAVEPPLGVKRFANLNEGWIHESMLSAIHSATPCIVKSVGTKDVISVQNPNGVKIYYDSDGEVTIVYAPDYKVEPAAGINSDYSEVSNKISEFFEAAKVACLRVVKKEMAIGVPYGPSKNLPTVIDVEIRMVPVDEAYASIAAKAGCDAEYLKSIDKPGSVPKFVTRKPLEKISVPPPKPDSPAPTWREWLWKLVAKRSGVSLP